MKVPTSFVTYFKQCSAIIYMSTQKFHWMKGGLILNKRVQNYRVNIIWKSVYEKTVRRHIHVLFTSSYAEEKLRKNELNSGHWNRKYFKEFMSIRFPLKIHTLCMDIQEEDKVTQTHIWGWLMITMEFE